MLLTEILLFLLINTVICLILNPACNYAKGKWVVDDSRPLYSGAHCKQWLSQMWACRLMQRTDFAYERLRWQPKDCQMEEFEGSRFLTRYYCNCAGEHFSYFIAQTFFCPKMDMACLFHESYLI